MFIIFFLFVVCGIISMVLILLNYYISYKNIMLREKSSSFECGFEMFESMRLPFSIHFFLISVLFLVFDIEIVYLFPMIESAGGIIYSDWVYCSLIILGILYLGLEYEKKEGSMIWFI